MYRKSMAVEGVDIDSLGSETSGQMVFINRVAELPACQLASGQLYSLYNFARERRLIGSGLKVGEGTVNFAVKMASPIVNKLPCKYNYTLKVVSIS